MRSKESKQARLMVACALIGAIIGVFANVLYNDFTWKKALTFIVLLFIFEYFLKIDIKHNT